MGVSQDGMRGLVHVKAVEEVLGIISLTLFISYSPPPQILL